MDFPFRGQFGRYDEVVCFIQMDKYQGFAITSKQGIVEDSDP